MPSKPSEKKGGTNSYKATSAVLDDRLSKTTDDLLGKLNILNSRVKEAKFDPKKHKDTKRSQIALIFVYGYMTIIGVIIVGAPLFNALLSDTKAPLDIEKLLSQVGSLIGAPLGFVIGYYFKEDK